MKMLFFAYLSILIACCARNNSIQMSKLQNRIMEFDNSYTETINKDSNIASVFLDYNFIEDVTVFDSMGQVIKTIKNDIENENVVMFQLLEKNDSMFHVITYWSLDQKFLVDGWICKKIVWEFFQLHIIKTLYCMKHFILEKILS